MIKVIRGDKGIVARNISRGLEAGKIIHGMEKEVVREETEHVNLISKSLDMIKGGDIIKSTPNDIKKGPEDPNYGAGFRAHEKEKEKTEGNSGPNRKKESQHQGPSDPNYDAGFRAHEKNKEDEAKNSGPNANKDSDGGRWITVHGKHIHLSSDGNVDKGNIGQKKVNSENDQSDKFDLSEYRQYVELSRDARGQNGKKKKDLGENKEKHEQLSKKYGNIDIRMDNKSAEEIFNRYGPVKDESSKSERTGFGKKRAQSREDRKDNLAKKREEKQGVEKNNWSPEEAKIYANGGDPKKVEQDLINSKLSKKDLQDKYELSDQEFRDLTDKWSIRRASLKKEHDDHHTNRGNGRNGSRGRGGMRFGEEYKF